MTTEPTAEDKAAAEAIISHLYGSEAFNFAPSSAKACADICEAIIAQHMAPERQAAAELREENEAAKEVRQAMTRVIERLEAELLESRRQVELLMRAKGPHAISEARQEIERVSDEPH